VDLSPTAYVILGMVNLAPRSGYEIKGFADQTTRFFWAASYGQIYPELKRLERAGLIEGTSSPQGGRKRKIFEITAAGREELRDWLRQPPRTFELRDEGLLKLFFSDAVGPEDASRNLRAMRSEHLDTVGRLRAIEPMAAAKGGYPLRVLRFGISYHQWVADACVEMENEILSQGRGEKVSS
jgi:PadR family transcriptional regulator AphA